MDQDADEPSDERGVADGAFTNGRSIAATRLSQTFCAFSLPDGVNRSPLFRDRAVSTLLNI